ncbi:hypothetical protein GGS26DRAFT_42633 [Hypomontagnella submonticulosa]|nr:hypothetical protein GGS26DRAFT_42633 [Hypomontagnella submonticulosa]
MQLPLTGALISALASLAAAVSPNQQQTTVTLWIPSSQHLPSPQILPSTTHATLTSLRSAFDAPLTAAGSFVFRNVTAGSYLADIHCGTHGFAPLRVDVMPSESGAGEKGGKAGEEMVVKAWETYRGNDWENKGQEVPRSGGEHGRFAVRALGPKEYFIERGSFSVLGILKNPMILMGLVSMVLFLGLPKLVENMDPEMRAEWEEQQKKSPMNALMGGGQQAPNPMGNFDVAAYMAGQGTKKDEGEPSASSNNGGGKKGGKR